MIKFTDLKIGGVTWIIQVNPIESPDSLKVVNFLQLEAIEMLQKKAEIRQPLLALG